MKYLDILKCYNTRIRKFKETLGPDFTGKDVLNYYRKLYDKPAIHVYMEHHFKKHVFPRAKNQEQSDFFVDKLMVISNIA